MMYNSNKRTIKFYAAISLAVIFFSGLQGLSQKTHAQGAVNISVTGIPPIIQAPFTDQIAQNFRNGRYQVIFTYNNSNPNPVRFQFRVRLLKGGRDLIEATSAPKSFRPGAYVFTSIFNELPFPQTFKEVLNQANNQLRKQVLQEGTIPEGNYMLKIDAIPEEGAGMIASAPSITPFTVRFPQAPRLINPADESKVNLQTPVFNWTPIVGIQGAPIEYDFLLVEVLPHQTPLQALNSNRAIAEKTLINQNTLVYTPEFLPLENGKKYVWDVDARLPNLSLPLKNDGESEFNTFTYDEEGGSGLFTGIEQLRNIPLVPGFADLTGLKRLEVTQEANALIINGPAMLQLHFIGSEPEQMQVQVHDLRLQKGSLDPPVVLGGSLEGKARNIIAHLGTSSKHVKLNKIGWKFGKGVRASASLSNINGKDYETEGILALDTNGARGSIQATGKPLFAFSKGLVDVNISELEATFPEGTISGKGNIKLLGEDSGCGESRFALIDNTISTMFRCDSNFSIPLVEDSDILNMNIKGIEGSINADLTTNDLDYNVELNSTVGLLTERGESCGTDALITVDSNEGLSINQGQQRCSVPEPKIDLGFIRFEPTQTELSSLSYDAATDDWDFELNFSAKLQVPAFDDWKSLELNDITLDKKGFHFNRFAFESTLEDLPEYSINNYAIQLKSFILKKFTFPLFDWDQTGPGPWDLSFNGDVSVPNTGNYPECVRNLTLNLNGGKVDGDQVFALVEANNFTGCTYNFGVGYGINISNLSGKFGVKYKEEGGYEPIGRLDFGGSLVMGRPFTCENDNNVPVGDSKFSFTTGLDGTVENVVPGCDVAIGPFKGRVTDSDLIFSNNPSTGNNEASMQAAAELVLPEGQKIEGSFNLDMITGEFTNVNFTIDDPFEWEIPKDDPVLTFQINSAQLNEDGFLVDGEQQLLLDSGNSITTTFDNFLIDLKTLKVQQGRIIFGSSFGLMAGINPADNSLDFKAVEMDTPLDKDPGLYMGLDGQIIIDQNGLHADGGASASVAYNGKTYDNLTSVDLTDDFSLQLFPFKVASGRANFLFDGSRFAYAEPDGFHPELGFFGEMLLPDKLPLPTSDVAYMTLRKDGELLVQTSENSDGNYELSTKPGKTLTIKAPFFDAVNPPTLSNVTLNNVVISSDPTNPEIISGSIEVDVPTNNAALQLTDLHVPLTLKKLYFGSRIVKGSPLIALYLLGDLHFFEEDLPNAEQQAEFYIKSDGVMRASLELSNMNAQVPLLAGNQVMMKIDAVNGSFSLQKGATSPSYDLQVDGGLQINTESGFNAGANMSIRMTPGTFNVSHFDTTGLNLNADLNFGVFGLSLKGIKSLSAFNYSRSEGFQFAISLDAGLSINPTGGSAFEFPLIGLEIRNTGINLPPQNIDVSSIPGLDLPAFSLAGFDFKPLSLNTNSNFNFSWSDGVSFNPDISMGFEVELPRFEGTRLSPPDGLTFTGVSLENGYLVGSVNPFSPLDGAEISLLPGSPDSPTLNISEISGSLGYSPEEGQLVDINLDGSLGNLPAFTVDDPDACVENPSFSLSLVDSKYFEGSISGIQPCGYLKLGPAKLSMTSADLTLSVSSDQQHAELLGGVQVELPSPGSGSPITAEGNNIGIDLITGKITSGSVSIDQPFAMNLPFGSENPLLNFTVNQAALSKDGFRITGTGNLASDGVQANVQFNSLQMGFAPFKVNSGTASIASDFGFQIGVLPLSLKLKDPASSLSIDNGIDMNLSGDIELNSDGLKLSGSSTATILFNGDEYASLRADLLDGFTLNLDGLGVSTGSAEFYDESSSVQDNLIAVLDESGFNPLSGLTALLPARVPLPTEDVAYIDIKQDGDLLVDVNENATGGYTLSTKEDQSLPVVIAGLSDQSGNPTEVDVQFSLTTDGAYNVTGGSLTLNSPTSLEPILGLPLSITELSMGDDGSGIELRAGVKVELPGIFEQTEEGEASSSNDLAAQIVINNNGIKSGEIELGTYQTAYNAGLEPVYSYEQSGSVQGSDASDVFKASLMGVKATFGSTQSIALSGTLSSSLIIDEEAGEDPLFFTGSYSSTNGWEFNVDAGTIGELAMGDATLKNINGIDLHSDNNTFYVELNGTVSMDDILGEPLDVTVQDLQVGVDDYDASPSLHFAIGQASGALDRQSFTLFGGALSGTIENPMVNLNGRSIGISSDTGTLTFLEKDIDYTNLVIDTGAGFSVDEITSESITLIDNYLTLNSLSLTNTDGLRLDTELEITLPKPVNKSSTATLSIYRDDQNEVQVETTEPVFDLNEDFALGSFGHFTLTKVKADINPMSWIDSRIYANGKLYKDGKSEAIIDFGDEAHIEDTPGISLSPSSPYVAFNATGNVGFTFDFSMFAVTVKFNNISADRNGFELTLNGTADVNLPKMNAELGYKGFIINQDGVKDEGNLDGSGEVTMEGIGTLTIGQFVHEEYGESGHEITLVDTSPKGPDELDGTASDTPETTKNVSELLCFGPCPVSGLNSTSGAALHLTINAGSDSEEGGFSGGVNSIFYYKTTNGEKAVSIDSLNISLSDNFEMNASFDYLNDGEDGMLLRAVASGAFNYGGQSASAIVAGKFSNIGRETSYGLFVAAEASSGLPIVPGIVNITGIGGGFFYHPDPKDIIMVQDALQGTFGYEPVDSDGLRIKEETNFAVLLYAGVSVVGGGGKNVLDGQTYMQITSNSFYMDARGAVLGMDGDGIAGAKLGGSMSLNVQSNPMFINGTVGVILCVPSVLHGSGDIEYFAKDNGNKILWGIMGNAEFDVLSVLSGNGEFLAANDGFMLTVGLGFDLDVPLIEVKSDVEASIWMLDNSYEIPFGAYATFSAKACLGVCISAEAKAALAKDRDNYVVFAAVQGCVDLLVTDGCVSAHATVSNGNIDAGFGGGGHNNLIERAKRQKEDFKSKIDSLKNQLGVAEESLEDPPPFPGLGVTDEDVIMAGANFYALRKSERQTAYNIIRSDVEINYFGANPYSIPSQFQPLINNVMLADRSYYNSFIHSSVFSERLAKMELSRELKRTKALVEHLSGSLSSALQTSIESRESAEGSFDDMLSSMSESPVTYVDSPDSYTISENVTSAPKFEIDQSKAQQQADNATALNEAIDQLDQQFRESIASVETNLAEMHTLLDGEGDSENGGGATTGVQALTSRYGKVLTDMQKYYALEANEDWLEWEWANNLLTTLNQQRSQIQSGILGLNNSFNSALANRDNNSAQYAIESDRVGLRSYAIKRFSESKFRQHIDVPSGNSSAPPEIKAGYQALFGDYNLQSIRDSVAALNMDFWYNMHALGLKFYANERAKFVQDDVVPAQNEFSNSIKEAHKSITSLLDKFYVNQASITSILYNMIDNYLYWKQSSTVSQDSGSELHVFGAPQLASPQLQQVTTGPAIKSNELPDLTGGDYYQRRLQELSDALVPPQINSVTANPSRPQNGSYGTYFNHTEITWNATHPVEVIENSIDIKEFEEDTDVSVGYRDYLSIGDNNSFTAYPFKTSQPTRGNPSSDEVARDNTSKLNVGVRARGYAGNTAVRRATFNVDVGPGGQTVSPGSSVLPDPQNETAPEAPYLLLSHYYGKSTTTEYVQVGNSIGGGSAYSLPVPFHKYWTNNPSVIKLLIQAYDAETGIATYEYAVGSSKGGTDIFDWSELHGTREELLHVPTSQMTGQTPVINMTPGQKYYVSIRVINGAGKTSPVTESSVPVMYDSSSPSKPGRPGYVAAPYSEQAMMFDRSTPVDPVLETVPALDFDTETANAWSDAETPNIKAVWGASTDDESGVQQYQYVMSTSDQVPTADFEDPNVRTTEDLIIDYSGSLLRDFDTELYIYVRAQDYAGNVSEIRKLGPYKAKDPTAPKSGKMQAKINYDDVKLYFTELPYDAETDLQGMQYAIGTSPGATDLRGWPEGDTVDFEWRLSGFISVGWGEHSEFERYVTLDKSDLPMGPTFYISYRSVNGQGKKSSVRSTGPINLDNSRPLVPSLDLAYKKSNSRLHIEVENIEDPESGIKSVSYILSYPSLWNPVTDWTSMLTHQGIKQGKFDLSKYYYFSSNLVDDYTDIYVRISIINGAGMERTVTKRVQLSDLDNVEIYQPVSPQYNFNF